MKQTEIDFGIGKIKVIIEPHSAIVVQELVDALKEVALVTPVQKIINNIKRSHSY